MDLIGRRRALIAAQPRLPWGYQEVEYLESTGTQYIDTGIITTSPWSIKVGVSLTSVDELTLVAGSYRHGSGYNDNRNFLRVNTNGQVNVQINQQAKTVVYGSVLQLNQFYAIEAYIQNDPVLVVNGQSYSATGSFNPNGIALYLFASHHIRYSEEYYNNPLKGKISYAEFYVSDELQRKYVPCYRKADHKSGLYDLVTKTFFTNSGTGEFLVGPNVN